MDFYHFNPHGENQSALYEIVSDTSLQALGTASFLAVPGALVFAILILNNWDVIIKIKALPK